MKAAFPKAFLFFATMVIGAISYVVISHLLDSVSSDEVFAMWWTSRAFGTLAYLALWLSVLFGVLVSSRGAGGLFQPAFMIELHTRWALVAIAATLLHVLLIVGDPKAELVAWRALVPFASEKATGALGLGATAMWLLLAIAASTYAMDKIPKVLWRAVHALAFGTYAIALAHAAMIGAAATDPIMIGLYAVTSGVLMAAIIQRVLLAIAPAPKSSN